MAARRRGDDVIDLSMGNPDGPTPKHIVDKLVEASQRIDTHGYSVSKGIPRLRNAICDWYQRRYGVELDPDAEAIVTIGSKEGLAHLMLACLERGDTVLVPNPSYPIHIYGAIIAGADIRSVRMTPGVDFFAELERAIRELTPEAEDADPRLPVEPDRAMRRPGVLREDHCAGAGSTTSWSCTTSPTPTSCSTATRRRRSCRCRARATWRSSSSPCRRATTWPAGASASWSATASWCTRSARIKSYHDYGSFTPIQVASIVALEGPQDCVEEIRSHLREAAQRDGEGAARHRLDGRGAEGLDVHLGQDPRALRQGMGSIEFAKRLHRARRRSRSRPASASATTATTTCASR